VCVYSLPTQLTILLIIAKGFFWENGRGRVRAREEKKKDFFSLFSLGALFLSQSSAPSQILILLAHFICEELYRLAWLVFFCFFAGTHSSSIPLSLSLSLVVFSLSRAHSNQSSYSQSQASNMATTLC
jgi:hypothetical protein